MKLVVADFDDELLEERGIPLDAIDTGDGVTSLLLAAGTLSGLGVAEGDLIGVRLTDAGLTLERVGEPGPGVLEGDRLVAALAADDMTFLDAAVWTACVQEPAAFTEPVVPLGELVDERGLVRDGEAVAPPGFDVGGWRFDKECERLGVNYELDLADAQSVAALLRVYEMMWQALDFALDDEPFDDDEPIDDDSVDDSRPDDSGPDENYLALVEASGPAMSDAYLAEILRAETVGLGGPPAALGLFAEALEPRMPRRARVAYRWLRAVAEEQMGDVEAAEREFLAAESMDPEWVPVLLDLARFASDRGDAERGVALLRRAGVDDDHPLLHVLERLRVTPRTDVGRNDLCPCGSGRKYTKCHLGRESLSIEDRVGWLYFKAGQHVFATSWIELLEELADVRAAHAESDDEADEVARDPLVMDAVLFEGGAFREFVERRGVLLPDDERALAERWLMVERSVFEVVRVIPGGVIAVRDVRTGDEYEALEKAASRTVTPGQLICARVVPVGDSFEIWGGVEPVAPQQRDALIELLESEPDPADLVEFLSARMT